MNPNQPPEVYPFPTPPSKHKDDTTYFVIHPVIMVLFFVLSAFGGGCIGASIALWIVT